MSKGLIITGATGKQGGATIAALLRSPQASSKFTILAVTRSPTSSAARKLASLNSNIKILQGDMNDPSKIFKNAKAMHPDIWGVLSLQQAMAKGSNHETEEAQGKALIDEALKNNVQKFVYLSAERGGNERSFENATNVPHFISKHNIEHHLVNKTKDTNMNYTILRPVAFMENWTPDFAGKVFGTVWKVALPQDKKLQLVSTYDVGEFAAKAFLEPEKFKNKAVGLAGDELTLAQANEVFQQKTGQGVPTTFSIVGHGINWGVKEMGTMFAWFKKEGFGVNIPEIKKANPGMLTLGDWLEKESGFKKQ